MVYLIGVDHIIQYLHNEARVDKATKVEKFVQYLQDNVKSLRVHLIAEEFSIEALNKSNATTSTAQKVAGQSNIEHRFCDPTTFERETHNIKREDHRRRERYWLDCISSNRDDSVIFICGSDHLDSFSALLLQEQFEVKILSNGWGKDISLSPF
jgi:hypothetical protein